MRQVLFRADSSSTIGTGHIMRDLVLAEREFADANVLFAVRDLPGNINHKIEEAGYQLVHLSSDAIEELAEKANSFGADTIVIDHYGIGYEEEKRLKDLTGAKLFVLDDTYERHHCDILLNPNVYAQAAHYAGRVPEGCALRCGAAHLLIRSAFWQYKGLKASPKGPVRLLVAMGGADTARLNAPILRLLATMGELEVDVVTTRANAALAELQHLVEKMPHVTLHIETEMAARMAEADLAILTPSVTVNEAIFMELPFVAIQTAPNQRYMSEYLARNGYPLLSTFDATALKEAVESLLDAMLPRLVAFDRLDAKSLQQILAWRNDPAIRRWMLTPDLIEEQDHFAYVASLAQRPDRRYFLARSAEEPLGVVDLTEIDRKSGSASIGLYARPDRRGLGTPLMRALLRQARHLGLQRLRAEVFADNVRARDLYRRFGFETTGKRPWQERQLWIMERTL